MVQKTSSSFVMASWVAMATGLIGYIVGLWRAEMQLNEKGYYFTLIMFGLFSIVSLQKSVRDRLEGITATDLNNTAASTESLSYFGLSLVFYNGRHY